MQQTLTGIKIVDARPDHAPFIAWVMLAAARSHLDRGFWDLLVGDDEARTLRFLEALASTPQSHFAHHSLFLVAEVEGQPAAALCGYFDEEHAPATLASGMPAAMQAIGMSEDEFAAGMQAAGSFARVMPAHVERAWIVEHVATAPGFRRRGLVDRLLDAMLERGRQRGATVADIGVLIGNDPAQRAYEKAGFAVVDELLDAEFEAAYACPGIRALSRPI
jgi:translation initiation factor 4G